MFATPITDKGKRQCLATTSIALLCLIESTLDNCPISGLALSTETLMIFSTCHLPRRSRTLKKNLLCFVSRWAIVWCVQFYYWSQLVYIHVNGFQLCFSGITLLKHWWITSTKSGEFAWSLRTTTLWWIVSTTLALVG